MDYKKYKNLEYFYREPLPGSDTGSQKPVNEKDLEEEKIAADLALEQKIAAQEAAKKAAIQKALEIQKENGGKAETITNADVKYYEDTIQKALEDKIESDKVEQETTARNNLLSIIVFIVLVIFLLLVIYKYYCNI